MEILILAVIVSFSSFSTANYTVQDLEEWVAIFNDDFREMKDEIIALKKAVTEQKHENDDLKKKVSRLQSENQNFKGIISEMNRKLTTLELENMKSMSPNKSKTDSKTDNHFITDISLENKDVGSNGVLLRQKEVKREIEKGEPTPATSRTLLADSSKGRSLQSKNIPGRQLTEQNQNVAFSVWVKDDITGLSKGDVIKFDGVMVNDGNGYDVTTGMFTAPRSGLYLFAFVVEDYHDQDLWVMLYEDNHIRSQAVAEPFDSSQNVMGGNVVLLHVREGSRIWIAISRGNRVQENWSTFTGILLH